jgi:hypothetical protein
VRNAVLPFLTGGRAVSPEDFVPPPLSQIPADPEAEAEKHANALAAQLSALFGVGPGNPGTAAAPRAVIRKPN